MRYLLAATLAAGITLGASAQDLSETATGAYTLDKNHAYLTFAIGHNGLSDYTVNFTDFDADLDFNAEDPAASSLSVTINPASVQTNYPDLEKRAEWHDELSNDAKFFNAGEFPEITFNSTSAETTGDDTGVITGDLTLLGVTKPVELNVTYNGTANTPWFGERDLIGFDATATIKRSDFGMTALLPNISDEVVIEFSGEFLQDEE